VTNVDNFEFGNARFIDTSEEPVSQETLATRYDEAWRRLERITFAARQLFLCLTSSDLKLEKPQQGGSALYFNKMLRHCSSLLRFCPEPIGTVGNFDRDSAASIGRVVYENYIALFYICLESVTPEEWEARNFLMGLRAAVAGKQMWEVSTDKPLPESIASNIEVAKERLKANAYFRSLPDRRQQHLLLGYKAMFFTQEEIDQRLGTDRQRPVAIYKILSNSVHSTPSAFSMFATDDWSQKEMERDLELSALALTFAAYYLNRATVEIKRMIPQWSKYAVQGFAVYKKLEARDEQNQLLSSQRKVKRRLRGELL
jgi:hypothetical protein